MRTRPASRCSAGDGQRRAAEPRCTSRVTRPGSRPDRSCASTGAALSSTEGGSTPLDDVAEPLRVVAAVVVGDALDVLAHQALRLRTLTCADGSGNAVVVGIDLAAQLVRVEVAQDV